MTTSVLIESEPWRITQMLINVGLVFLMLGLAHLWQINRRVFKMVSNIPGPPTLPLIGNAHLVLRKTNSDLMKTALEYGKIYGNVVRGWLGPKLVIFLTDPLDAEVILSNSEHNEKSQEYSFFKKWLGEGLLISKGEKWRSHRKMIAPTFHINILKSFVSIFNQNSLKVVQRLEKEIGKEFDVHDHMSEATVNILLETAMGVKSTRDDKQSFQYAMAVMEMCDIIHQRHYKFYYRFDALFKLTGLQNTQKKLLNIIHSLTRKVIKEKNEIFEKNMVEGKLPTPSLKDIIANDETATKTTKPKDASGVGGLRDDLDDIDENDVGEKRRLAFLDLMIETKHTGETISDEEIKEEVDTIMFEGHDTTAAGSSFVLCMLGVHKDVQQKVFEEQQEIFGNSNRMPTFADTVQMKYLERVIMETLRMYPPVPIIARKVNRDVKLASGDYTIPAGTTVVLGIYKIHHRADYYPNPEVFNPDNFLTENMSKRHYYSFIPFSAGPRSCVGRKYAVLKLKILLSTIVRKYKINSTVKEEDFKLQADIILKRTDGFRIEIEKRQ